MTTERLGKINLINGDCMDYMRSLPDKAYDLAIVDPPYGGLVRKKQFGELRGRITNYKVGDWDYRPDATYFKELRRVSKQYIIWGANYFTDLLDMSGHSWIVWDKVQPDTINNYAMGEMAVFSGKKPMRIFTFDIRRGKNNIADPYKARNCKIHPTQKPVQLYKWLLAQYANHGDRILDTHLGSGSICLACHDGDFEMTGIEIDADYYAGAVERLKQHQMQKRIDFDNN